MFYLTPTLCAQPHLLSGADDRTIKIWDYQTKCCLQTLEGHGHNVSSVCFHPRLPLIVSASEDGTVRLWHSTTYRPETTLNYGMERAWCLAPTMDANKVAIGYDEGTIVLKLGNEQPVSSMDRNTGKVIWASGVDIQTLSLKGVAKEQGVQDGEKLVLNPRDLGSCEVYPQNLKHNSNGQFIVLCGDGEYIVYTSQALRNKTFGSALDFVWSSQSSGDFAIRESTSRVKIFKNFKEYKTLALPISCAEGIHGGACLAVTAQDSIVFFDWDEGSFIRKIDVSPTQVLWNEIGNSVALACSDSYFILYFDKEKVMEALSSGSADLEEGIDGSFELETTMVDVIKTGQWVGECLLFINDSGKLNYYVGGEVVTLAHLDREMYLLGFVPREDRVFLIDKMKNIFSYKLSLAVLNYQTFVVRKDFDSANRILPNIPSNELISVAKFLESQGFKEEALEVTTDMDHKFELAVDLRNLKVANSILSELKIHEDDLENKNKWKKLGDLALHYGDVSLALSCAQRADDFSGLLLMYSSVGNKEGMLSLAERSKLDGRSNVAFLAYFVCGHVLECIQLLIETNRLPEAAFFARTYMPSKMKDVLDAWKEDLKGVNEKAAEALADPSRYPNLFPDLDLALEVEQMFFAARDKHVPASKYTESINGLDLDLIQLLKEQKLPLREEIQIAEGSDPIFVEHQPTPISTPMKQDNAVSPGNEVILTAQEMEESRGAEAEEAETDRLLTLEAEEDAKAATCADESSDDDLILTAEEIEENRRAEAEEAETDRLLALEAEEAKAAAAARDFSGDEVDKKSTDSDFDIDLLDDLDS